MAETKKGIGKAGIGLLVVTCLVVVLTISNLLVYITLDREIGSLEMDNESLSIQVDTLHSEKSSLEDQVGNLQV